MPGAIAMPEMREAELKAAVLKIAKREHWLVHHNTNSWAARSSQQGGGYPDLTLARAGMTRGRLLLVELKREGGKLEPLQEAWREALEKCPGIEYYVWYPSDLWAAEAILSYPSYPLYAEE
jgi:hypothetical protein